MGHRSHHNVRTKTNHQQIKKSKAPGPDDITTDLVKEMNEENLEEILDLINEWWIAGEIPENMLTARVASLYKKGNPGLMENYRPISLLNTFYKILAAALQRRISGALGHLVMKNQYGFTGVKAQVTQYILPEGYKNTQKDWDKQAC